MRRAERKFRELVSSLCRILRPPPIRPCRSVPSPSSSSRWETAYPNNLLQSLLSWRDARQTTLISIQTIGQQSTPL